MTYCPGPWTLHSANVVFASESFEMPPGSAALAQASPAPTDTGSAGPADVTVQQLQGALTSPSLDGWDVALALIVVLAGWITSRYAARAISRVLASVPGFSEDLRLLAARVVRIFIVVLGFGVALSVLGVDIHPVLAASVLVAVVAALSLRGVAENFSAGLVIQSRQPIRVGDRVEILDFEGVVKDVNSRSTILNTVDGREVHLPNQTVLNEPLTNDSVGDARRSELEARWNSRDIDADRASIDQALRSVDDVLDTPSPALFLVATDGPRVVLRAQFWHLPGDGAVVRSAAVERVTAILATIDEDRAVFSPPPLPPLTSPPLR